jgi:hypothetical protein
MKSIRNFVTATFILNLVGCYTPELPNEEDFARLKQEGDALIKNIEAFRLKNGNYPQSFMEAGLVTPERKYDGFKYINESEDTFRIFIGNNNKYGFYMYYINSIGKWEIEKS